MTASTVAGIDLRYARFLRDNCPGFEDPEEMCTRDPDRCRCGEARAALRARASLIENKEQK